MTLSPAIAPSESVLLAGYSGIRKERYHLCDLGLTAYVLFGGTDAAPYNINGILVHEHFKDLIERFGR
jgi:hypothetical protein